VKTVPSKFGSEMPIVGPNVDQSAHVELGKQCDEKLETDKLFQSINPLPGIRQSSGQDDVRACSQRPVGSDEGDGPGQSVSVLSCHSDLSTQQVGAPPLAEREEANGRGIKHDGRQAGDDVRDRVPGGELYHVIRHDAPVGEQPQTGNPIDEQRADEPQQRR